jgi:uncharacterized metal-binding protein YceD (DUF177 family)
MSKGSALLAGARLGGLSGEDHSLGRVVLGRLESEGAAFPVRLGLTWVARGSQRALGSEAQLVEGHLEVSRLGRGVLVEGELKSRHGQPCDRCLADLEVRLGGPVRLTYEPEEDAFQGGEEEVGLEADQLDVGWFSGGALELEQVICEQLALWLPDPITCEESESVRVSDDGRVCELPAVLREGSGNGAGAFSSLAGWRRPD